MGVNCSNRRRFTGDNCSLRVTGGYCPLRRAETSLFGRQLISTDVDITVNDMELRGSARSKTGCCNLEIKRCMELA